MAVFVFQTGARPNVEYRPDKKSVLPEMMNIAPVRFKLSFFLRLGMGAVSLGKNPSRRFTTIIIGLWM